ncbi:MAG: phosphodiesterase [Armatimonadota bacterium]
MKIGVVSDTHGNIEAWKKVLAHLEGADIILHAGDVLYHPPRLGWMEGYDIPSMAEALNSSKTPIVIAQGNCDSQVYEELLRMPVQSPYAIVQFDRMRIVVNHGHLLTKSAMFDLASRYGAEFFIFGHTHIPVLEERDGIILMNPGSPAIPKLEIDGRPIPSVGVITDTAARIINIEDGSNVKEICFPC